MELEAAVLARLRAEDHQGAATLIVRDLGPELYAYVVAMTRHEDQAEEAFAIFSELLWKGLRTWSGTGLRSWSYAVARSAIARAHRDRRRSRMVFTESPFDRLAVESREPTAPHRRTTIKDAVQRIRGQLPRDELELLILRVDRGLSWTEVARVVDPEGDPNTVSTRLRKRFQRARSRLRSLAVREGILA